MANEEQQSNYSDALDKFVSLVVSSVDTNHGEWKDRLVTMYQVEREFEANPIGSAMLCACVYGMLPDDINPGDTEESRDLYSQFCTGLSHKLIDTILPCLVTAHNLRVAERN